MKNELISGLFIRRPGLCLIRWQRWGLFLKKLKLVQVNDGKKSERTTPVLDVDKGAVLLHLPPEDVAKKDAAQTPERRVVASIETHSSGPREGFFRQLVYHI